MRFTVLAALLTSAMTAQATPRFIERNQNQRERIKAGVASGELTRPEARRMRKGERQIHRLESRAKKDGVVTPKEARRIEKAQDRMSKRIYKQKHDDQSRS